MSRKASYAEQLKDPRWQKRRLEIMQRDGFACAVCGSCEHTLNIHHIRYVSKRKPWEYPDEDLSCVCESCHQSLHEARDLFMRTLIKARSHGGLLSLIDIMRYYEGRDADLNSIFELWVNCISYPPILIEEANHLMGRVFDGLPSRTPAEEAATQESKKRIGM